MRTTLRAALVVAALLTFGVAEAQAGAIRGRLVRGGNYPAAGIAVTVYHPNLGRSGVSYSGYDGMYYLYNIPPGNYSLELWNGNSRPFATYNIAVYPQPMTDIAPIGVP